MFAIDLFMSILVIHLMIYFAKEKIDSMNLKGTSFSIHNKFILIWSISLTIIAAISRNIRWALSLYTSFTDDN